MAGIKAARNDAEAMKLFMATTQLLGRMCRNGIKVSTDHFDAEKIRIGKRLEEIEAEILAMDEGIWWKKKFGSSYNITANEQLDAVLFDYVGAAPTKKTAKGRNAVDKSVLEKINSPFSHSMMHYKKLDKCRGTYINQILREEVDGFVHPFFGLLIPRTFRTQSNKPNFQNQPIRDDEQAEVIRSGFIPRHDGWLLGEFDFSGLEVRIGSCYHKDPAWIRDMLEGDMHRDTAMECYRVPLEEMDKKIRYCGKNKFVFPECYGDYYKNCAMALWEAIDLMSLKTASGVPLRDHLRKSGLKTYEAFENHIKKVESNFWNVRYPVYAKWRETHYERYCARGFIDMYTGFRCSGLMSKNDVCNYVVQGAASHCLLKTALILQKWLDKNRMRSLLIGQIHDSVIMDIHPDELISITRFVRKIVQERLPESFPWISVPMDIEFEVAKHNQPWVKKKAWDFNTDDWKKEKK